MAELVDALDSGSSRGNSVDVRVILAAILMKKIAIVANGAIHDPAALSKLVKAYAFIVAADGGLLNCHAMGITPNLIIGDMDSTPNEILKKYSNIPIKKFPVQKDKTDLEIAIETVITSDTNISIFAALERRLDHTLYNLHLLRRYSGQLKIESEYETIFIIEKFAAISCHPGQTVSLLPLGPPAKGVKSKGLKWELNSSEIDEHFMSISNICLGSSFEVEISDGILLCCLCKG